MTYTYLLESPTFTYQWIYVDEDGGNPVDVPDATSDTYIMTSADDMKYLQVEVTFEDTRTNSTATRLANKKTFQIVERQSLQIPTGLTATPSSEDGNVRLRWSLTTSGDIPAGFKYRYKPTALADTEFTAWVTASGGPSARSVTITGNLINNAQYTFEVASYTSQVAESDGNHSQQDGGLSAKDERLLAVLLHSTIAYTAKWPRTLTVFEATFVLGALCFS